MPAIKIFIVDDQALVRAGFSMLLSAQDDMEVVGEAADGAAALAKLACIWADVVLMDVRMPIMDGVETTSRLLSGPAGERTPRVLVLTTFDLDEYVFAALKAGASGFMLKDARPDDLLSAIRAIADGDAVVAPSATRRLLEHVANSLPDVSTGPDRRLQVLTAREQEVLVQIANGLSNSEIADHLFMAESTVKTHVGSLLSKLQCRDRVGLVLFAFETRLVRAGQ